MTVAFRRCAACLLLAAAIIYADWLHDAARLRSIAAAATGDSRTQTEAITALTRWVYRNQGFAKNRHSYGLPMLGPTPAQVLRYGGDCADKSRLLSAMLAEAGIPSGLLMIFTCADCPPVHTVVEAETTTGKIVADPIWDVVYPGGAEYLAQTGKSREIVAAIQAHSPADAKIRKMPPEDATFDYARAINWRKSGVLRAIAPLSRLQLRPRILENPQLFLAVTLAAIGFLSACLGLLPKRRRP